MFRRSALIAAIQLALATSAVAGVASVFMQQGSMAGRTAGTALVVLLSAMCLLPLSRPSTDGRTSSLEILWSGFVLVGAGLTLGVIWRIMPPGTARDMLWMTDAAWIGYGIPTAMVLLPALRRRATPSNVRYNASARLVVFGAGVCFLAAVAAQVGMQQAGSSRPDFAPIGFILSIAAVVLAAANLASFRVPRPLDRAGAIDRAIGVLGVLASAGGWAAWMAVATMDLGLLDPTSVGWPASKEALTRQLLVPAVGCTGLSISGALWCALRAVRFRSWAAVLPWVTAGLTLLLSATLTFAVAERGLSELLQRTAVALGIMDASALLTVVLLLRARRSGPDTEDFVKPIDGLPMKCPRCAAPRVAALGESACGSCGLVLLLAVRDDRCPACQYDLRGQAEGACPECGRIRQTPGSITPSHPRN